MVYRANRIATALALSLILGACGGSSSSGESGDGGSDVLLPPARIVLAGTIGVEANTRVDADTADGLVLGELPLTEPQLLPASFILAGYVSFRDESRGTNSPFDDFPKDPEDQFRVPFEPGERLSLRTFSGMAGGPLVTLALRRLDGTELESQATDPINKMCSASVSLPATEEAGDYLVVVSADDFDPPPVRYVLSKTAGAQSLALNLDWPGHAFVPGRAADIINLSLGGLPEIPALQNAIDEVVANGVIVVAAAGNQASSSPAYPAAAEGVFSVSAVDAGGSLAGYSNFGPWIDLAAPGGDVRRDANLDGLADLVISSSASLGPDGFEPDYTGLQGTSMAAPHVAGVFALMKSLKPDLNTGTLVSWLAGGQLTTPVPGGRSGALGYGTIDSAKAVLAAIDNPSITILSASPAAISLSSETRLSQTVELLVLGDQTNNLVINPAIASPAWLDVTLSAVRPFSITVTLNEQALEEDVPVRTSLEVNYTTDSTRVLHIPVVAELVTDENARNAGRHFVLLVYTEPNEQGQLEAAAQVSMTAVNGTYQFGFRLNDGTQGASFADVPPGDYYLVAGSDLDNDGIICQSGEACAEYPVTGMREVITVDENTDLKDIRMATGYFRPTISTAIPDVLPRPGFTGYKLKMPHSHGVAAPKKIGVER